MEQIVVIGGGHAAAQLCAGLAEAGIGQQVQLVCEEPLLPYQRPPLSKTFLKNPQETTQVHKAENWYHQAGIIVHVGDPAVRVDRENRRVHLRSGTVLTWTRLVLATGTRARAMPGWPADLANVVSLRMAEHATRLRELLAVAPSVTVIGGGFIGLEVAATAAALGKPVTVLESAPRLMGRAVSPMLSEFVLGIHRASGIDIRLNTRLDDARFDAGRLTALSVGGQPVPVDLVVMGIGAVPETTLAEAAGLECSDGVIVDASMRTNDPAVLAIGDCTRFADRRSGKVIRLESVQNANDQARTAVATLRGEPRDHDAVPWFWSDQGTIRLQMAGLVPPEPTPGHVVVRRPGASERSFSLFHYVDGTLRCVESVNAAPDHIAARKLLDLGRNPDPALVGDPSVALKTLLA
ncbi:MAG: FAD-dependent oxidoreductase [Burkholderiaceae bacterium]